MADQPSEQTCALCQRTVSTVSKHHLVPKEEGGRYSETVPLCQPCHSTIHGTFTNKELKKTYHTIEALRAAEQLQAYLQWISRSKVERIRNRRRR
ncbi:MAG: HNH endonuclease [Cytophagales bacterium]|nr:HNH endonuclease [Cytophagales bacterium]